ncbi:MAG: response regulator [Phormidesmis sp.]
MRILLVDDDEALMESLAERLIHQRYAVDIAIDGNSAHAYLDLFNYDLIVLDLMLPDGDGIEFCRQFRRSGYVNPLMILTAKASTTEKVTALDAGADDYVIKPFDFDELCARIRALLRRENEGLPTVLKWGAIQLDPSVCELMYAEQLVRLTPKEFSLMELFLRHPHRVHSLGNIMDDLWSLESPPGEDAIRTHIKSLRRKLRNAGAPKDLIKTVYGLGYRLNEETAHESQPQRDRTHHHTTTADSTDHRAANHRATNHRAANHRAANHRQLSTAQANASKTNTAQSNASSSNPTKSNTSKSNSTKEKQSINLSPTAQEHPIRRQLEAPDESLAIALTPETCQYLQNAQHLIEEIERVATALPEKTTDQQMPHTKKRYQQAQKKAQMNAHKLAGSLGSFGLAKGSKLAQRIESQLSASTDPPSEAVSAPKPPPQDGQAITQLIQQLHQYINVAANQACTLPDNSDAVPSFAAPAPTSSNQTSGPPSLLILSQNNELIAQLTQATKAASAQTQLFLNWPISGRDGLTPADEISAPTPDVVIWDTASIEVLPKALIQKVEQQGRTFHTPPLIALVKTMTLTVQRQLVAQGAQRVMGCHESPEQIMAAANTLRVAAKTTLTRIAIADDDPLFLSQFSTCLDPSTFTVNAFTSAQALWQWLYQTPGNQTGTDFTEHNSKVRIPNHNVSGHQNPGIQDVDTQDVDTQTLGTQALKAKNLAPKPDILLLDVEMPGMSGIELCQILRADAQFQHLPIIVLTIHNSDRIRNQAFQAGADDFISKANLTPQALASRIQNQRFKRPG